MFAQLKEFPDRAVEWLLGFMTISWGVLIAGSPGMGVSQSWGWCAIMAGLARLGALYVNGAHHRTPAARVVTSFLSMFLWFWITVQVLGSPVGRDLAIYPWLMLAEGFSVYRAGGDAFEARQKYLEKRRGRTRVAKR